MPCSNLNYLCSNSGNFIIINYFKYILKNKNKMVISKHVSSFFKSCVHSVDIVIESKANVDSFWFHFLWTKPRDKYCYNSLSFSVFLLFCCLNFYHKTNNPVSPVKQKKIEFKTINICTNINIVNLKLIKIENESITNESTSDDVAFYVPCRWVNEQKGADVSRCLHSYCGHRSFYLLGGKYRLLC